MPRDTRTRPFGVLIVDDEADIRELLAEYFRDKGFEVGEAADGRAAVTAIEREPARYGLIIADLNLPGADGLAVLKAAKRVNAASYVVIITGYASLDSAIQAVRLGAYDYLTKPFSMGQIDVLVERIEDRLTLEQENRLLARQLGGRVTTARDTEADLGLVAARLAGIDDRLARVESLLSAILAGRPERRDSAS
jgi:DNA-binding NtrC family response regulator